MSNFHLPDHQGILGNEIAGWRSWELKKTRFCRSLTSYLLQEKSQKLARAETFELLEESQRLPLIQTTDEMSPSQQN